MYINQNFYVHTQTKIIEYMNWNKETINININLDKYL